MSPPFGKVNLPVGGIFLIPGLPSEPLANLITAKLCPSYKYSIFVLNSELSGFSAPLCPKVSDPKLCARIINISIIDIFFMTFGALY